MTPEEIAKFREYFEMRWAAQWYASTGWEKEDLWMVLLAEKKRKENGNSR